VHVMRAEFGAGPPAMIRYKAAFLKDYPAIGAGRGMAYDYSRQDDDQLWNSENVSGLERRLARLLGIRRTARRNLGDVAWDQYAQSDSTPGNQFRWRVRHRTTGHVVLSSTKHYPTQAAADDEMRRALHYAAFPSAYRRRIATDGRRYFLVVDDTGDVIGRRQYFSSDAAMEAAIIALIEYVQTEYGEEGMYVIENILLRPEQPGDRMLPICPEPDCVECAEADPYSYRIHVVLPAFGGRFADLGFRRWAEEVIREEVPAHIEPKVCWVGRDDMAALEKLYRDWIYLRSGRETAGRAEKLDAFVTALYAAKNVYPPGVLNPCDAPEGTEKFVLGQSALGTGES
jgi:hypothetical protein